MVTALDPVLLIPDLSRADLLSEHELGTSLDDERTVAECLARQVEYASVLAVSQEDAVDDPAGLRQGVEMLRQLHP
ncbi:MAG TPA: cobalamin biosynthesis protein CobW, partial [Streptosporangiaceae bacterium]|nr:cobalamin biosynthesis protein CobW [Streptosporangiaceae bacterium]